MEKEKNFGNGLYIFSENTSAKQKKRYIFFTLLLSLIIIAQAFYWVFANRIFPIVWGMPFGMFTVVVLIIAEFTVLAALYYTTRGDS